ncbi:MAG: FAD-dependent thymidylate synthase [Chlorobiales bacterium]
MNVRLISVTKPETAVDGALLSPEGLIAYCARVSSPNQENPNYAKLLQFCIRKGHWSVFEMVDMTLEITTTRAIAPQILRHRSFSFQEFSQRYAKVSAFETYEARRQDQKNRQNSFDDFDESTKEWFREAQREVWEYSYKRYEEAIEKGIAKESARALLPLNTITRLYMKGSVRSWIHYFQVRCDPATQKEHRDIALAARDIFIAQFPTVAEALSWNSPALTQNGTHEPINPTAP